MRPHSSAPTCLRGAQSDFTSILTPIAYGSDNATIWQACAVNPFLFCQTCLQLRSSVCNECCPSYGLQQQTEAEMFRDLAGQRFAPTECRCGGCFEGSEREISTDSPLRPPTSRKQKLPGLLNYGSPSIGFFIVSLVLVSYADSTCIYDGFGNSGHLCAKVGLQLVSQGAK